jgi:hypothetical protein
MYSLKTDQCHCISGYTSVIVSLWASTSRSKLTLFEYEGVQASFRSSSS